MKKIALIVSLIFLTHQAISQKHVDLLRRVTVTFYNNSVLPRKFTFISYALGETKNGTIQTWLKPQEKMEQTYSVGTRLYLAGKTQVNTVMSGKRLEGIPFRIIAAADNRKLIKLNN